MKIYLPLFITCLFSNTVLAEAAPEAPKSLQIYSDVSGFHSYQHKKSGFEFRIIEVDGSSSVAMNPITLYLVVTNNLSGSEYQSKIVRLPNVSKINKIKFSNDKATILIESVVDNRSAKDDKVVESLKSIKVSIPLEKGRIGKVIDVTQN